MVERNQLVQQFLSVYVIRVEGDHHGSKSRNDFPNTRRRLMIEQLKQGVDAEVQAQIRSVGFVLDQDLVIASLAEHGWRTVVLVLDSA